MVTHAASGNSSREATTSLSSIFREATRPLLSPRPPGFPTKSATIVATRAQARLQLIRVPKKQARCTITVGTQPQSLSRHALSRCIICMNWSRLSVQYLSSQVSSSLCQQSAGNPLQIGPIFRSSVCSLSLWAVSYCVPCITERYECSHARLDAELAPPAAYIPHCWRRPCLSFL